MSNVPDLSFCQYKAMSKILSNNGMTEKNLTMLIAEELGMTKEGAYFSVAQIVKNLRNKNLVHKHSRLLSPDEPAEISYSPTEFARLEFPYIRLQENSEVDPLKLHEES